MFKPHMTRQAQCHDLFIETKDLCCRSEKVVIAAAGFDADASTLKKVIQQRNIKYQNAHKKPMSVTAAAQLVGNTLYMRRFFPYYSFTLVCGIDAEGTFTLAAMSVSWKS